MLSQACVALDAQTGRKSRGRADQRSGTYYYRNLLLTTSRNRGLAQLLKALKAEGVDVNFWDYPEQHKLKVYSEAKWWHHAPTIPASMPGNAYVNGNHILRLAVLSGKCPS